MTKRELLENYREIVIDIEGMDKRIAFLSKYIGGPQPVRAVQITGMPRGTNNPEAAMEQRDDFEFEDIISKIRMRMDEARHLTYMFEIILEEVMKTDGRRLHNIIQYYYGLGYSEEKTAEKVEISQSQVNRLRNDYLSKYGEEIIHG